MLWLKQFDQFSLLLSPPRKRDVIKDVLILRPGGLGDLVVLTEALCSLGFSPKQFDWIVERRNAIWLDYLGVTYRCYDSILTLSQLIFSKCSYKYSISSEQTFGLAALLGERMCGKGGTHFGFSANKRNDLFDIVLDYDFDKHEFFVFKSLLENALSNSLFEKEQLIIPEIKRKIGRDVSIVALGGYQIKEKTLEDSLWLRMIDEAHAESEHVLLLGAMQDKVHAQRLVKKSSKQIENLVGEIHFACVVDFVRQAKKLYATDSGLVHVADFFSVPSRVYFQTGNSKKWGPRSEGSEIVSV